jgi:hypothetical protein
MTSTSKIEVNQGRIFARPCIYWQQEELGVHSQSLV